MSACPLGVFDTGELHPQRCRELAARFKDGKDLFRIVIVRDMWLTGFDAPCPHQPKVSRCAAIAITFKFNANRGQIGSRGR
jgi:hypothetical protein